jgi:hypothetical protein
MELRQREPRERDERHLRAIRQCPCVLCKGPAEAAHVRYGDPERGKRSVGIGERPSDCWVCPLCPQHHRLANDSQHATGDERAWWEARGIDPLALAARLYAVSPDVEAMTRIVMEV